MIMLPDSKWRVVHCAYCNKPNLKKLQNRGKGRKPSFGTYCTRECQKKHQAATCNLQVIRTCENCGNTFTKKGHGSRNSGRFCTRSCYQKAKKNGTFKGSYKSKEYLVNHKKRCKEHGLPFDESVTREALVSRYGPNCYICGKKTGWQDGDLEQTVEHVVPLKHPENKRHGHTWDNCLIACVGCNSTKNRRTTPEMIASEVPVDIVLQSDIPVLSTNEVYSRHP